jgi:hypothetical protein
VRRRLSAHLCALLLRTLPLNLLLNLTFYPSKS